MEQFEDISFKRLTEMLCRHVAFIIAFTMIAGVASFLYSKVVVTPMYESSVTMYVKNEVESNMNKTLGSDIQTSQMLVDTYIVILKSDTFLNEVNKRLVEEQNLIGFDATMLRNSISASSVDATEIFKVSVKLDDPLHSRIVANVIADTAPDVIKEYIEASSVKVIDYALNGELVSPNVQNNMLLGLLIGFLLSCLMIVIRELFDTRIKTDDDLVQWFNLPILGVIPDISEAQNRKGGYAYRTKNLPYETNMKEGSYNAKSSKNELDSKASAASR